MSQSTLERRLGPLDGAAIIVSNVIGGTILFARPMADAELAALRPKAGGEYVYLDAAYGRVAAFLTGWTSFVAGFAGAIAANAFFIPIYLARFIPGVDNQTPIFTIPLPYVPLVFSTPPISPLPRGGRLAEGRCLPSFLGGGFRVRPRRFFEWRRVGR